MIPSPDSVTIPQSYETVPTTHIKLSHHPAGSPTATPVVILTLNRPKNQNAFTLDMMKDFEKVYPMFDVDERVKVIVLTGAGKTFSAGADLDIGFHGGQERVMDHRDSGGRVALAIHRCRKPTIVAMQGSAVGLGMTITLPAAIRYVDALTFRASAQYLKGCLRRRQVRIRLRPSRRYYGICILFLPSAPDRTLPYHVSPHHRWCFPSKLSSLRIIVPRNYAES